MTTRANPTATDSPVLTYAGVAIAAVGFLVMLLAWGVVSGREELADQLAPAVGIGLPGLGLVMVGVTVVNLAAKQADGRTRQRQLDQLLSIVGELHRDTDDATLAEETE